MSPGFTSIRRRISVSKQLQLSRTLNFNQMRPEKANIVADLSEKLNASPFLLVTDYQRMNVDQFRRTAEPPRAGWRRVHVVKNSFSEARDEASGLPDVGEQLTGQTAVVTGRQGCRAGGEGAEDVRGRIQDCRAQDRRGRSNRCFRRRKWKRWPICRRAKFCWRNCSACCMRPATQAGARAQRAGLVAGPPAQSAKADKGRQTGGGRG